MKTLYERLTDEVYYEDDTPRDRLTAEGLVKALSGSYHETKVREAGPGDVSYHLFDADGDILAATYGQEEAESLAFQIDYLPVIVKALCACYEELGRPLPLADGGVFPEEALCEK